MGKPSGGGGSTNLFTSTLSGSSTVGTESWIDLGLIPSGKRYWIGLAQYTAVDKVTGFELRTNLSTKSTGTTANTSLISTASVRTGNTVTQDLYKGGTLHTETVLSTGVEHWWIRIYSKSSTPGTYSYKISYVLE